MHDGFDDKIWFLCILLSTFASMSIREIGTKFSFFAESLCGLSIRVNSVDSEE